MKRKRQLELDFGAKYVRLLEDDLKRERELSLQLRADVEFYRGKCERLELALFNQQPAGKEYVQRTEPAKPSIRNVRLETALRPVFSDLKRKWNALSAEEQDKAIADGWNVQQETEGVKQ